MTLDPVAGPSKAAGDPTRHGDVIFMLARQRSGTNPLRSVLDQHPDIFCIPEIFNTAPTAHYQLEMQTNYFRFSEQYYRNRSIADVLGREETRSIFLDYLEYLRCFSDRRYILIDVKYNSTHHLNPGWHQISDEPHLLKLLRETGACVLNLKRSNFLRYYVSERKAQETHRWHSFDSAVVGHHEWYRRRQESHGGVEQPMDVRVRLDVDDLLRTLELCAAENDSVDKSFSTYDRYLAMEYEDLFPTQGPPVSVHALRLITGWLQVPDSPAGVRPAHRKQSDLPLHHTVENWEEVRDALRATPFEAMTRDEPGYRRQADDSRR